MTKPSKTPINEEAELPFALYRLNLFYPDESAWVQTFACKKHVDLFGEPIPIDSVYYKRINGRSSKPLMILSAQSFLRLCQCVMTENPKLDAIGEVFLEEERRLMDGGAPPAQAPPGD
ncbi:MAG TPA: hypothetical protein VGN61_06290 [Verrucomicrobiae bacterium]